MTQISSSEIDSAFAKVDGRGLLDGLLAKVSAEQVERRLEDELARLIEKKVASRKPVAIDVNGAMVISDLDDLQRVATMYASSGLVPGSYLPPNYDPSKPEMFRMLVARVAIAISFGKKFGMDPLTSLKWVYVVNNVPSLWGDAVPGIVRNELRKRGEGYEESKEYKGKGDERACTVTVRHVLASGEKIEMSETFGIADAQRANLMGKMPWKASPDRMMLHRARTYVLRNLFPDIMMGLAIKEEQEDVEIMNVVAERKTLDERLAEAKQNRDEPTPVALA